MPPQRRRAFGVSFFAALTLSAPLRAGEMLAPPVLIPSPSGPVFSAPALCDEPHPPRMLAPCPPTRIAAPCADAPACAKSPRVVVEMSQPEVRFVAPRSSGGSAGACGPVCADAGSSSSASKVTSFLNFNFNRSRTKAFGGAGGIPQPVTTVVPSFATATVPIALQTTQFVTGTEVGVLGSRRDSLAGTEAAEFVRDAVRRELGRQESARLDNERDRAESATLPAASGPSCAELKTRVDKIEQRLEQIEKKVESIATKLSKLP